MSKSRTMPAPGKPPPRRLTHDHSSAGQDQEPGNLRAPDDLTHEDPRLERLSGPPNKSLKPTVPLAGRLLTRVQSPNTDHAPTRTRTLGQRPHATQSARQPFAEPTRRYIKELGIEVRVVWAQGRAGGLTWSLGGPSPFPTTRMTSQPDIIPPHPCLHKTTQPLNTCHAVANTP